MKRRHFIKSSVMGAGAIRLSSFPHYLYAGDIKKYAHDRVTPGNTGIEVSPMAMGTTIDELWAEVMLARFNPGETRMDGSIPVIGVEQAEQLTDLQKRIPASSVRG